MNSILRIITLLCFISLFYPSLSVPITIPATSTIYTQQNDARASYGIPSFTIDQNLVNIAQGITEQCNWSDSSWKTSAQTTYAQDLGVSSTSIGFNKGAASVGDTSINLWLAQKSNWNCLNNTCNGTCGSWTQIIWENSVNIGCALSTCTTGSPFGSSFPTWEYLLCMYNPAGNMNVNGVKQHPFGTDLSKCNSVQPVQPTTQPTAQPPVQPTTQPTAQPTVQPTQPAPQPTAQPTAQPQPSNSSSNSIPATSPIYTGQNDARASYGIPSFTIDQNLVNIAQGITNQCNWGDSSWRTSAQTTYAQDLGVSSTSIGFNMGAASVGYTSIDLWLAQKANWNCTTNSCSGSCGSWTQIIWENSLNIGCALSTCTTGSPLGSQFSTWEYLLCLYNPAGNFVGQHPFGTDLSKCSAPQQASLQQATIPQNQTVIQALHSEETTHTNHHLSVSHDGQYVLSVGALVGIVVGSIIGVALIVVAAIQLRAKMMNTPNTVV